MQVATIDTSKKWTVADYLQLGEDFRYQLINGELIMSPAPNPYHQKVSSNLHVILKNYAMKIKGESYYSPIDIYLNDYNVYQPDLILLTEASLQNISNRGIEGAPELVVEILSPSNSHFDRYQKKETYQKFGVKEYWMIDPNNKSIEILNFKRDKEHPVFYQIEKGEIKSLLFEDLIFELSTIF